ncbi:MAG: hypothetical protein OEZ43_06930 [Gammaproteobacteria bacterium]|nr:hypothetical protein [Gammaproteobacteria bacterium]
MIAAHATAAKERWVRIVNSCGFDALPSDIGHLMVQKAMKERHGVYSSNVSMRVTRVVNGEFSGGTLASAFNNMEIVTSSKDKPAMVTNPNALVPAEEGVNTPASNVKGPRWDRSLGKWTAPYLLAAYNSQIVRRSNALAGFPYGRDFQYGEGVATGTGPRGWLRAFMATVSMNIFVIGAMLRPTRAIMRRMMRKPGEGPSKQKRDKGSYRILFSAHHPDNASVITQLQYDGERDPGYGSTCRLIAECAVRLAVDDDVEKVPGGFWTPASCLGEGLAERLEKNAGIKFTVL